MHCVGLICLGQQDFINAVEASHVHMPKGVKCTHDVCSDYFPANLEETGGESVRTWRFVWWEGFDQPPPPPHTRFFFSEAVL
jgi:hypothetical protein